MKSIIFALSVLGALGYLAYSQVPPVAGWVDHQLELNDVDVDALASDLRRAIDQRFGEVARRWDDHDRKIAALEAQLDRLGGRLEALEAQRSDAAAPALPQANPEVVDAGGAVAPVAKGPAFEPPRRPNPALGEELAELADRMERKALGLE